MPDNMNKKRKLGLEVLVHSFRNNQSLDPQLLTKLAGIRKPSKFRQLMFTTLSKTGVTNLYWNNQLKKNNVYQDRFATPYKL